MWLEYRKQNLFPEKNSAFAFPFLLELMGRGAASLPVAGAGRRREPGPRPRPRPRLESVARVCSVYDFDWQSKLWIPKRQLVQTNGRGSRARDEERRKEMAREKQAW